MSDHVHLPCMKCNGSGTSYFRLSPDAFEADIRKCGSCKGSGETKVHRDEAIDELVEIVHALVERLARVEDKTKRI